MLQDKRTVGQQESETGIAELINVKLKSTSVYNTCIAQS